MKAKVDGKGRRRYNACPALAGVRAGEGSLWLAEEAEMKEPRRECLTD